MDELPAHIYDNTWRAEPIHGAPPGKCWRMCDKPGHTAFYLVKAFHGVSVYQCLECRKIAKVETRTGKTCMGCGKPLTGRQHNWCDGKCAVEMWRCHDRSHWVQVVKQRDNFTCQRCGYQETPETKEAYRAAWLAVCQENRGKPLGHMKAHRLALERSGTRQLEAHHITPLEWGGPEFDPENGRTLCEPCHDQEHRELGAPARGGKRSKETPIGTQGG